jgi:hypothetical protein
MRSSRTVLMLHRESQRRRETPLQLRTSAEGTIEVVVGTRAVQRVPAARRGSVERVVGSTPHGYVADASVSGFTRESACMLQDRMKWSAPPSDQSETAVVEGALAA